MNIKISLNPNHFCYENLLIMNEWTMYLDCDYVYGPYLVFTFVIVNTILNAILDVLKFKAFQLQ